MQEASSGPHAAFERQGKAEVADPAQGGLGGPLPGSRQWAMDQAIASAMIEGYVPNPDFVSDAKLLCQGLITDDEMQESIKRRALVGKRREAL